MKPLFEIFSKYRLVKQFITGQCPLNCFACPFKGLDEDTGNQVDLGGNYLSCLLEGGDVLTTELDFAKFTVSQLIVQTTAPTVVETEISVLKKIDTFVLPQVLTAEESLTLLGRNVVGEQEEALNILRKLNKKIIFTTLLDDTNIDTIIDNYYHAREQGAFLSVNETDVSFSPEEREYLKYLIAKKDVIASRVVPGRCLYSLGLSFNVRSLFEISRFLMR